ncbi:hypothetical protein F5Y10DRAFT_270260 [Nemania abortiva]|nr:hypothetical protein F5Y10DRAFT_270260 [Nemania abortiva]
MIWTCLKGIIIYILFCVTHHVPVLTNPLMTTLSQVLFRLLQLLREASIRLVSALKRRYLEYLQNREAQARANSTLNCENCPLLQNQVNTLESELTEVKRNGKAFDASLRRVWNEHRIELESDLKEANTQLNQTMRFLRAAETQVNAQRGEIRSLKDELRLTAQASDNADFQQSLAIQRDLEQLRRKNAQLITNNLQQWNNTLEQKRRALKAETEAELRADWIKTLTGSQRDLRQELVQARRQLQHQTKRADEQREARVRLEVENEELRFTALRSKHKSMFA